MRRMYSENQIKKIIEQSAAAVVEALKGQDISINGLTSKGIANTGALGNIGNVAISGNLTVSGSINEEENPSVKPVYCHPIFITYQRSASQVATFTCLIFNNSSEPFTKTTFLNWCLDLFTETADASIMASGYMGTLPASRLKKHPTNPTTNIALETVDSSGATNNYYSIDSTTLDNATFVDGVNKIN